MIRMAAERVQSIKDWLEVQSKNASHAIAKADPIACQHSKDMLDLLILIVTDHYHFQETMTDRVSQANIKSPCGYDYFRFSLVFYCVTRTNAQE